MISFERKGDAAEVVVTVAFRGKRYSYALTRACGSEWAADALVEKAWARLGDLLEGARKEAYAQGYRDGRGHRERERWFSRELES